MPAAQTLLRAPRDDRVAEAQPPSGEKMPNPYRKFIGIAELTFPYDHGKPTEPQQPRPVSSVANTIAEKLRGPVFLIGLRNVCITASRMLVPKAAVHKDDFLAACENQIWVTRKFTTMEPKTVAQLVSEASNKQFRFGILRPDPAHILAAPCL
jgi:hypothetical protein